MIQYKVFVGTIAEIEAALNAFCAGLPTGANVNMGALTRNDDVGLWYKEIMYVLPQRSNNGIAVPQMREVPRGRQPA